MVRQEILCDPNALGCFLQTARTNLFLLLPVQCCGLGQNRLPANPATVSYKPAADKRLDVVIGSDRTVLASDGQFSQSAQQNTKIFRQCTRPPDRRLHHALEGIIFDMPAFAILLDDKTRDGPSVPPCMGRAGANQPFDRNFRPWCLFKEG